MTDRHDRDQTDHLLDIAGGVDVGQGYTLAWNVGPDGGQWPVLVDQRQHEAQFVPSSPDQFRSLAPHELTGRLPEPFRQFRCGAPTRTGRPCKAAVAGPGERCGHHPQKPQTPDPTPSTHRAPQLDAEQVLFDLDAEDDR